MIPHLHLHPAFAAGPAVHHLHSWLGSYPRRLGLCSYQNLLENFHEMCRYDFYTCRNFGMAVLNILNISLKNSADQHELSEYV